MINLKIKGNRESYQLTKKVDFIEINLNGNFSYNLEDKIDLSYDNHNLKFENRDQLFKFSEEIRGVSLDKFILVFSKYGFDVSFINSLAEKKSTEIGLLKALFLIYNWIDLPLLNPSDLDLEKNLFNEFIIDWSSKPESQKDIYFISKNYISKGNSPYLQKLMDLNLLASFEIKTSNKIYETYFIPFTKPGVSRENFKSEFDKEGIKTYAFWKAILNGRNTRINNWMNNRF